VVKSIKWSICHQGARVWIGDTLRTGQDLYNAVIAPMGNGSDRDHVADVYARNGNSIDRSTIEAIRQCKAEFPENEMIQHMYYVCWHEGNSYNIRHNLESGKWDEVRSVFSLAEKSDDRVRNVLYGYNATDLTRVEQLGCPAHPR
jgi:hypothetical protein